jgi:hypothetical protein
MHMIRLLILLLLIRGISPYLPSVAYMIETVVPSVIAADQE